MVRLANDAAGNANVANHQMKTPFTMTTDFKAQKIFEINNVNGSKNLEQRIEHQLGSHNHYYAIKATGTFDSLSARRILPHEASKGIFKRTVRVKKNQQVNIDHNLKRTLMIFKSSPCIIHLGRGLSPAFFKKRPQKKRPYLHYQCPISTRFEIDPLNTFKLELPRNPNYLIHIDIQYSGTLSKVENPHT